MEEKSCNTQPCPIDCQWTSWSEWGTCSKSCGSGMSTRNRTFEQEARHGGNECQGEKTEQKACKTQPCPIHCKWINWSGWTDCNKECGSGISLRIRTFEQEARHGGDQCQGDVMEEKECNTQKCPCTARFWDYPNCKPCQCYDHATTCDPKTGECINCSDHTTGHHCDKCIDEFYGDPTLSNCMHCNCNTNHTIKNSNICSNDKRGQCQCLKDYAGRECSFCKYTHQLCYTYYHFFSFNFIFMSRPVITITSLDKKALFLPHIVIN